MNIEKFEILDSTNDYLKNKKDIKNYDIVSAKVQTKGRGTRGRKWLSDNGGALFSIAIKKEKYIDIEEYKKLSLITGISVLEVLEEISNKKFYLKWVNDIYINDKKICGILNEFNGEFFIIGIGINVNTEKFEEGAGRPTSLFLETKENYDIDLIIEKVFYKLKERYFYFLQGNWKEILERINEKNYLKDKKIIILKEEKEIEAMGKNINEEGELVVEINGELENLEMGEVIRF